ncbi:putative ribonuclease H-like domain-containing protein, partial [Tanacetum coccineum]
MNYVPVVAGTNSNDLVGTEESIGAGHSSMETGSSQDYILMPLWKDGVNKESGIDDQERPKNSTQDVNTVGPNINTANTNVNTSSLNINTVNPTVTTTPLEATHADFFSGVLTRRMTKSTNEQGLLIIQALKDPSWIEAMQEELIQFKLQQVWTLVDLPLGKRAIGTKWVYRNKKYERGIVIRNKARLVVQGYTHEEGIDYD